jgi:hypothetical protein
LIYEWNGDPNAIISNAIPAAQAVFQSLPLIAPSSLTQVFFNTPGVVLDPAKSYVAFIGGANLMGFTFSLNTNNPYLDGLATASTNPLPFSPGSWTALSASDDLAFTATLAAVPEPGTLVTLASGLSLLVALIRRRH